MGKESQQRLALLEARLSNGRWNCMRTLFYAAKLYKEFGYFFQAWLPCVHMDVFNLLFKS